MRKVFLLFSISKEVDDYLLSFRRNINLLIGRSMSKYENKPTISAIRQKRYILLCLLKSGVRFKNLKIRNIAINKRLCHMYTSKENSPHFPQKRLEKSLEMIGDWKRMIMDG